MRDIRTQFRPSLLGDDFIVFGWLLFHGWRPNDPMHGKSSSFHGISSFGMTSWLMTSFPELLVLLHNISYLNRITFACDNCSLDFKHNLSIKKYTPQKLTCISQKGVFPSWEFPFHGAMLVFFGSATFRFFQIGMSTKPQRNPGGVAPNEFTFCSRYWDDARMHTRFGFLKTPRKPTGWCF